ncbi:serine/threonine protein kinase [Calothrix parasitica NIES-267]|uniref:Serine/threonine protein kinase n=1 Tax=Calothrix parasitica NIES-267 TaxID=1973488 RepID=A0A1Z4LPY4_9CYAN|nr:serine/threonine protein kinase [Calothrix parasitica NIES-267]
MQFWQPGQELQNGKFTIQKYLGGGGYGETYSAIDTNTNKTVVIKILNDIHRSKPNFEQEQIKFVQEAFRLVQCSHPHIVKVHEVINENGLWGMVMEYIRGEDLYERIDKRGKLSEAEALKYINQIGTALEYVHQQGMLHRDVKPNNIMLRDGKQEAVLIDFGLAREFDLNKTGSMTNARTEGYAPIEQDERHGKFGPYTDVYALAATLYALVTGETPLPASFRQTGISLPAPKQRNPNISDVVNDGIMKGMGLEPHERTQTVREWLELFVPSQVKFSIPLQKFKFEYAKIDKNLKITKYPGQAGGFTENLGNGVTLEMVSIPGGSFIMGAPENEEKSRDNERPQHKVNIQPFFMGRFQVTQEQYQVIMGENQNLSRFQGQKRPVEKVTWYNAAEFCTKLSKLTGKQYRLPSEAEWEYACRAGTTTPFHFGETITTDLANYEGTDNEEYGWSGSYGRGPKGICRNETTPVGSFPANSFGLYDMHGNVWEWCLNDWHRNYQGAPTDGSAWFKDENNNLSQKSGNAILRGGSWLDRPAFCRSASRLNVNYCSRAYDYINIGFRVVCAVGRT